MSVPDPGLTRMEAAKILAQEVLHQHTSAIVGAAHSVALTRYGTVLDAHPDQRDSVTQLATDIAVAVLRAIPSQYRGPNGDYVTIARLRQVATAVEQR